MAMLPKSIKDKRAIAKCPTIYRIYCKARGFDIAAWNREHLEFWGAAVKGSSALSTEKYVMKLLSHPIWPQRVPVGVWRSFSTRYPRAN
eukprot:5852326-Pyramimonas_sp.AAC.1